MKKQADLQLLATLSGGILFNYLFWQEKQALNLLLYSIFILVILLLDKEVQKSRQLLLAGSSHLLAAVLVVINLSDLTVTTCYISLAVFVGFAHFQSLKSILTALMGAFLQIVSVPINLLRKLTVRSYSKLSLSPLIGPIKYIVIPMIILFMFIVLYCIANPVFANYVEQVIESVGTVVHHILTFFFADLSFLRFFHVLLGIGFTAAIVLDFKDKGLETAEAAYGEKMTRKRKPKGFTSLGYEIIAVFAGNLLNRMMALKTENIIGMISFAALNLLLLFLNSIDVATIWLNGTSDGNLSAELHDGTNALIISIVLAMLIIVYFFSGNLNFYSRNKGIRLLAYLWIVQNAFLVVSVLLRDYHYIAAHGLTYKRIGVIIFLSLCIIGLFTVYIKVARQKTLFYLCRVNTFIWYVLLLAFGFVNWDVFIVGYNINNRNAITLDINHLISMSDKTLPVLHRNKALLKPYLPKDTIIHPISSQEDKAKGMDLKNERLLLFERELNSRIDNFKKHYHETSWLSWNYRDWQTYQYFH